MWCSVARLATLRLALFSSLVIVSQGAYAQIATAPPNLSVGDAVTTGFSGVVAPDPAKPLPADKSTVDLTFINPDGASAEIADVARPGHGWDASLLQTPPKFRVTAGQVGQVFGVAIGDAPRPGASPNIYLGATSLFGLQITHRLADGAIERLKVGAPDAQWADGQFGPGPQVGPGSIYVVNGATGLATLLANIVLDGAPNPGPGLGNLAYDPEHKQLFASDLYTGMIHRIGLDGADLGHFDHGASVRPTAQLPAMPFDPNFRMNIASPSFDANNPDSWGFAPPARQVWAVVVHEQRLFYSVLEGPQIWSVGLQANGDFASDARLEINIPGQTSPLAITDIAFSPQGAMAVSERNALGAGFYNYTAFTRPGEPRVLRFWLKKPTDPPSPGLWNPVPEEVPVGFAGDARNTNGGLAFGYGYDENHALKLTACGGSLLITGEKLRDAPELADRLAAGGPLFVDGLQINPPDLTRDAKAPEPWASYFFDYDGLFVDDTAISGHQGSVRTLAAPCGEATATAEGLGAAAPFIFGGGPDCQGPNCGCEGRDCQHRGRLIVEKKVVDHSPLPVPPTTTFPIQVNCGGFIANMALTNGGTGTINNIPYLTTCTVTEPLPTADFCPKGWTPVWTQNIVTSPVQITAPVTVVTVTNTLTCEPQRGSLIVEKKVENHSPLPIPPATTYPIEVNCGGVITNMPLTNGGTQTVSNLLFGTNCTITEPLPTMNFCPRGETPVWSQQFSPGAVTINGPTTSAAVVNILDCKREIGDNKLTVVKRVEDRGPLPIPPTTNYPINVNCGGANASIALINGGSQTVNNISSGTSCTVSETPPTLNVCPPRMIPHWTTTYSPASTLTVPPSATIVVLNVMICEPEKVCVKPLVMNAKGECVCPPPMTPGAVLNQCICPQGQQIVDGACAPVAHACNPPMVTNAAGECACPPGTEQRNGACVKIVKTCLPPLVTNAAGQCVAKPVDCGPNMVSNGAGTCVCRPGLKMVRGVCRDLSHLPEPTDRCTPPARRNDQGQCVPHLQPRRDDPRKMFPARDGSMFPPH